MKKKIQMSLDDMLFEHKNKDYGAYAIRQAYKANLTKATVLGSSLMLFVFLSSFVLNKLHPKPKEESPKAPIVTLIDPPLIIPDIPEPEIPQPRQQRLVRQVEFPPQVRPVENNEPEDEQGIPNEEELKDAAIGNETLEGPPATGSFVEPATVDLAVYADVPEPPAPPAPKIDEPLLLSEVMPEFEGGMKQMYKWLGKNLRYPNAAAKAGVQGKVVLTFVVEKSGQITGVKILKGIGFGCDEEASRVLEAMPKWKPGLQNGRPVRVRYTLPLNFKLDY